MTDTDRKAILLRLIEDAGPVGIKEEDLEAILRWIEDTRLSMMMVELWEANKVALRWKDGEPSFRSK